MRCTGSTLSKRGRSLAVVAALALVAAVSVVTPAAAQHVPDTDTVLLDAFDGTTQSEEHGSVNYTPSLAALGEAVDLEVGAWLKYGMPGWNGEEGTIEAWISPNQYGYSIALLQWANTDIQPGSGYVGHFTVDADGHLQWGSWGPPWPQPPAPVSTSVIPLDEWTHVAATWSPMGTRLYVNGVEEFATSEIYRPYLLPTTYVYVNGWGNHDHGLMDELRISSVARTEAEIRTYVLESMTLIVDIDINPGSETNPINLKSKGVIPVAILTTDDFDASTVDPLTAAFGPGAAAEAHEKGHLEDVDYDGDIDLVLHFSTPGSGIEATDTEACLFVTTYDGWPIEGCDTIEVK